MTVHDLTQLPGKPWLAADIVVPERLRPIDPDYVAFLAASIEEHGQQQAVVVRMLEGRATLVAGAHRLSAVIALGMPYIGVSVRVLSDEEARLVEIDENLCRRELSALDRGLFLLERKTVYQRLNPAAVHGGDRKSIKSQTLRLDLHLSPERFTKDVADKVGLSERAVQLAISIAEKLDPEAVASLRGTSFANNQNALLRLSQEQPAAQRTLASQLRDGKAKTLDAARISAGFKEAPVDDPQFRAETAFIAAWEAMDEAHRIAALREIAFDEKNRTALQKAVAAALEPKPAGKGRR